MVGHMSRHWLAVAETVGHMSGHWLAVAEMVDHMSRHWLTLGCGRVPRFCAYQQHPEGLLTRCPKKLEEEESPSV